MKYEKRRLVSIIQDEVTTKMLEEIHHGVTVESTLWPLEGERWKYGKVKYHQELT